MTKHILAVDIETLGPFESMEGVTCIGLADNKGDSWTSCGPLTEEGMYLRTMRPEDISPMLKALDRWVRIGSDVVTWNGAGFDFRVLAEFCPEHAHLCRRIALNHIDIAFQMFCNKGFMVGLNAASSSMKIGKKIVGMDGLEAAKMWTLSKEAQERVLMYCKHDAVLTLKLYQMILEKRHMTWVSKRSGNLCFWWPWKNTLGEKLLTVKQSLELPKPDTSWMDEPWEREKFVGWLEV